jgi:single-stranded DNA-specific DHH superfamily exonuclease
MYLVARGIGISQVDSYFRASFSDLSDPFQVPGYGNCRQTSLAGYQNREKILIHGDYDTDGNNSHGAYLVGA